MTKKNRLAQKNLPITYEQETPGKQPVETHAEKWNSGPTHLGESVCIFLRITFFNLKP